MFKIFKILRKMVRNERGFTESGVITLEDYKKRVKDLFKLITIEDLNEVGWEEKDIRLFEELSLLVPEKNNLKIKCLPHPAFVNITFTWRETEEGIDLVYLDEFYFTFQEILGFYIDSAFFPESKEEAISALDYLIGEITYDRYAYTEKERKNYVKFNQDNNYQFSKNKSTEIIFSILKTLISVPMVPFVLIARFFDEDVTFIFSFISSIVLLIMLLIGESIDSILIYMTSILLYVVLRALLMCLLEWKRDQATRYKVSQRDEFIKGDIR